jgi:hypothetical protein
MNAGQVTITLLLLVAASAASPADTPDCSTFTWNMKHELALFGGAPTPLASGTSVASAPQVDVDMLYEVDLHPLAQVAFAHPLGKSFPAESSSGAVLKLRVRAPGSYRISTDAPLWVDVVAGGDLVTSTGFQGRVPCTLIHKSVAWTLPVGTDLIVQIAGAARDRARFAVTAARSAADAAH